MHRASVASLGKKTTNDVTVVLLRHSHRRTQLFCRVASGIWWPRTGIDRRNKSLALLSSTLLCVRCVRATLDFRGSLQIPARVSLARNTGVMVIMAAAPAAIAAATAVSICPLTARRYWRHRLVVRHNKNGSRPFVRFVRGHIL